VCAPLADARWFACARHARPDGNPLRFLRGVAVLVRSRLEISIDRVLATPDE
jgi:hypothetical protein